MALLAVDSQSLKTVESLRVWQNSQMAPCSRCDGLAQRFNIGTPYEYQSLVRQLIEVVNQGTFLLVEASCPLRDVLQPIWPGDAISHKFKCFACGRTFELFADTYHGNASWSIGDLPGPIENSSKPN